MKDPLVPKILLQFIIVKLQFLDDKSTIDAVFTERLLNEAFVVSFNKLKTHRFVIDAESIVVLLNEELIEK